MQEVIPVIPATGFLRVAQIIGRQKTKKSPAIPALIAISRSTWWAGVKSGRYPQPTRALGKRITAWRCEDIRALIDSAANGNAGPQA